MNKIGARERERNMTNDVLKRSVCDWTGISLYMHARGCGE